MTDAYDLAVVGAGIVGLGAAYAAARRGLRVVVLDRTTEPVGSTVRNFGHLCFTPQSGTALRYSLAAREAWLRLSQDADFWIRRTGTHVVARHADEMALLAAATKREPSGFGDEPEIQLLDPTEASAAMPVDPDVVVGGALLPYDLQTDPRSAAAAIIRHLTRMGVEFRMRTSVGTITPGTVQTSRGIVRAETVVVAVNHDLDQLFPELAEASEVVRCALDMLRVQMPLRAPLNAPLLTGWSLIRYSGFASLPEASAVRSRLHSDRPELAAIDLNQMYTQLPDGSVIVGDSHHRSITPEPFQDEDTSRLLLDETELLFGAPAHVIERWQGVYASGADEFLVAEPLPGVIVLTVTTGIGMTTGLGLAETTLAARLDSATASIPATKGP